MRKKTNDSIRTPPTAQEAQAEGASSGRWRTRLTGRDGEEAPEQLLANPFNYRVHPKAQQEAIEATLDRVGWIQRVIVNERTGHVIDGHARIAIAISRGEPTVPVTYVDLDPQEEAAALLTFDPLGGFTVSSEDVLAQLIRDAAADDDPFRQLIASLHGQDAFLNEARSAGSGASPWPENSSGAFVTDLVPFSVMLTVEQRTRLMKAITATGAGTTADGLMRLIEK